LTDGEPDQGSDPSRTILVAILIGEPVVADRIERSLGEHADLRIVPCDQRADVVISDAPLDRQFVHQVGTPLILIGDHDDMVDAISGGAAGVVRSDFESRELALVVEAVARGLAVMPAAVLDDGLDGRMPNGRGGDDAGPDQNRPTLTPREAEVLALVAAGASNKVIARKLDISIHTAKFHVASILGKLDATGRADAIAQAARLGLLML
jgi:DNA-binding NarL/FixJ family response regulator